MSLIFFIGYLPKTRGLPAFKSWHRTDLCLIHWNVNLHCVSSDYNCYSIPLQVSTKFTAAVSQANCIRKNMRKKRREREREREREISQILNMFPCMQGGSSERHIQVPHPAVSCHPSYVGCGFCACGFQNGGYEYSLWRLYDCQSLSTTSHWWLWCGWELRHC